MKKDAPSSDNEPPPGRDSASETLYKVLLGGHKTLGGALDEAGRAIVAKELRAVSARKPYLVGTSRVTPLYDVSRRPKNS